MTVAPPGEVVARKDRGILPGRKLLEGLSRCSETVFLADPSGRVLWSSDGMNGNELFIDRERGFVSSEALRPVTGLRVDDRGHEGAPCVDIGELSNLSNGGESLLIAVARKESDTSLQESTRATLDAVLGSAPDAILAIDPRGRISFANSAAAEVLGWAPQRIFGVPLATLLADIEDLECVCGCLQGGESLRDRSLVLRSSGGGLRNVSASSCALGSDLSTEPHTLLYLRDIGDRMRNEAELVRTNEELEHCVNALSHDLRSPLVALLGFSRLLRQDYADRLDETARHFIERIEQAGRTMESLVHDLLELSRIGQPKEPRMLVDPRSVLAELRAELKPKLDTAAVELVIPDDPPLVFCDRIRLYQVFSNLIGNAIEHGELGNGSKIQVEIRDMGDVHQISVLDDGCGILRENHEKIFDVFQSLSRSQDRGRGTGIGLAIVKKIAELHGGRVWVESEPKKGSTFYVTFHKAQFDK